jgi:hypothetical protein
MSRDMENVKVTAVMLLLLLPVLTVSAQGPEDITADADLESATQVKEYYADWLHSIPGVSRIEVANSEQGQPEIKIDVGQMTPQIKQIPDKLNGVPVVIAPLPSAGSESLSSSETLGARGYMPSPTPEIEISPVPTPQGNKFWRSSPYSNKPDSGNP